MKQTGKLIPVIGLFSAETLSLLGNQVAAVTIPVLVLQYTHSPMLTGLAAAANVLPIVLAAMLGGRAIDRFGAWNMSVIADLLSFISVTALPLVFLQNQSPAPFLIFFLVFAGALFDPTGVAARQTLVPTLAQSSGQSLQSLNSWRAALENGADFLGPVIGVAIVAWVGVINTFYANAASFLLCAVLFAATVPCARRAPAPETAGFMTGLHTIFNHPALRSLAVMGMLANLAILPFLSLLLPVLSVEKFGSAGLLGISLSVFGLAATLAAASFSKLMRLVSAGTIYFSGLLLTGTAMLLAAFATNRYEVIGCSALAGLLLGAGNPLQQTVVQLETPEAIRGSVFTAFTAIHFISGPIGIGLAGLLTQHGGIDTALQASGIYLIAVAGFGWKYLSMPIMDKNHESPQIS